MARKWRSRARAAIVLLTAPALLGAATPAPPPPPIVQIGSAYIAKQLCSCLFVVGRSEASCRAEFKPDIDPFTVAIDRAGLPDRAKVTASLGPVVGEAAYARPFGCMVAR